MVKVDIQYLEDRQAKLVIEIEPARMQRELKDAARRISREVNIPGFRKGKAPYRIIAQYFGESAIYQEALDKFGPEVFVEALEEAELTPYAPGSLDDMDIEGEPVTLTFTVPLPPEIDLGDYREMQLDFEPPEVTDEDVETAITNMREQEAILEPVERAVETGDVARMNIRGVVIRDEDDELAVKTVDEAVVSPDDEESEDEQEDDDLFIDRTGARVRIDDESTYPVPGFPAQIIGMVAEDIREFDITLAEDDDDIDESMRGETIHFTVTLEEVYSYDLPELDDEFAQSVGDYETVEDLRNDVRERLERSAEQTSNDEFADKILDKLINDEIVTVAYPPVMIDQQVDDMINDFQARLSNQGLSMDVYLKVNEMEEDDLRGEYQETAEKLIKRGLILGKLIEVEHISVGAEEIDDEIETRLLSFGEQAAIARQLFNSAQMRETLINQKMTEKAIVRLGLIARGEAPDLSKLEAAAADTDDDADEAEETEAIDIAEVEELDVPASGADPVSEITDEDSGAEQDESDDTTGEIE